MIEIRKKDLEKQGYRLVGNHSSIKVCLWCKKAIRKEDTCYKHKFYGISSWRCIQASVTQDICTLNCDWCWRDVSKTKVKFGKTDEPKEILSGFIKEQILYLQGFKGNRDVDKKRLEESFKPKHVALSLTGETCLYSKLPEMVEEIKSRCMTSFIVTNGTVSEMIKKLIKVKPTQLYITLPAPNKSIFTKVCKPKNDKLWDKILESLSLLGKFDRGTVRLTLAKNANMLNVEDYVSILKDVDFKFLETKAFMPVGFSKLPYEAMPKHEEIKEFSKELAEGLDIKLVDEKKESRVCLLMKKDVGRKLNF